MDKLSLSMKRLLIVFLFVLSNFSFADTSSERELGATRFGICAHLSRWEFDRALDECKIMSECGIKYFRTDYDVGQIKNSQNAPYDFSRWDSITAIAAENGVDVLPIIPGARAPYMVPLAKNLDKLYEFVRDSVAHFKGKIKYWEIINEPNLIPFWDNMEPSPEDYAKVLETCYRAVKDGNPDAKVLYAGVAGVPLDYIERTYKAGAGKYFDIMNIHPYQWATFPESGLRNQISELKELMKKYGLQNKPIWITEVGNSSGKLNPTIGRMVDAALQKIGIDKKDTVFAVIEDSKYFYSSYKNRGSLEGIVEGHKGEKKISFSQIKDLNVSETPVLVLAGNEHFPYVFIEDLYQFAARGGTILSPGGFPFYYDMELSADGTVTPRTKGADGGNIFRIGAASDFPVTSKYKPRERTLTKFEAAPGFETVKPEGSFAMRFTDTSRLREGDEFIPIVYGVYKDVKAPIAGIYKYGGDMKGNFIVICPFLDDVVPEPMQAKLVARTLLTSYALGIEKIFLYNFRNNEADYTRESHFGIVRRNLEKKPSFYAYQTVVNMLGDSAVKPNMRERDNVIYILDWTRPDGTKIFAVWSTLNIGETKLSCSGKLAAAYNHLGEKIKVKKIGKKLKLNLDGGIVYLEGLDTVDF